MRRLIAACAALLCTLTGVVAISIAAAPEAAAVPNPPIEDSCGLDVTLVLDASGSIQSSNAVSHVRDAAEAFLDGLVNTNSRAIVTQFGTLSQQLAPSTLIDDASMGDGGALRGAINGYYNPRPPRPNGVNLYQYLGGSTSSASSFRQSNSASNDQYTNWQRALQDVTLFGQSELVVFITDGDPTAYDFATGDPIAPPAVAFHTDASSEASALTLARSVAASDAVKNTGARMLTVGVGSALSNPQSVARLVAVTGPKVVRDGDLASITSLNDIDVALVTSFANLALFLRHVVLQLCSPSLTIRKLAQSASDADYLPAPGWSMTATPTTQNGQFDWLLPDTAPGASKTVVTDQNGFAQFQWEPEPGEQDSAATVSEAIQPGYTAGRPGPDNDVRCELRDEDGNVRVVLADLVVANGQATFALPRIGQEIVTCTVWNAYQYQPGIAITKVNTPTEVRGDLNPPATVTSNYVVTNPGNTPLRSVQVTDSLCAPVVGVPSNGPNAGDLNADDRLDVGEAWQFTCTKPERVSASLTRVNLVNTATVTGVDPSGTTVSASASDDVDVFYPRIQLDKLANGAQAVTVDAGEDVTYTYAATNIGDTPLGSISLVDDTPPCTSPTRGPDGPGNGDDILDVGETWTYSCLSENAQSTVLNTAVVTGTPLNPVQGNVPFPNPNPVVSDTDAALVTVARPGITLTKTADPTVILLPQDPTASAPVTYTFAATNTGDTPLNRPGATTTGPAKDPGWVVDPRCAAPPTYVSGDADDDDLLDPDETWTFTCTAQISARTVNVATIVGQPSEDDGTALPVETVSDLAVAVVDVLRPGIQIVKTALTPVVMDENIDVLDGPDDPVRPAQYLYDVTNTGSVPLDIGDGPSDDHCAPLTLSGGDANSDGLLDPTETWTYTCSTPLDRTADSNTPPVTGLESGTVTNVATVTGVPVFEGTLLPVEAVVDQDQAQVLVIEPGISITKTASAPVALADSTVQYTFVVSNAGDVGLEVVGPYDDQCPVLDYVGGDLNNNGLLDGVDSGSAEQWTYTCSRAIPLPTPPAVSDVNTVEVLGIDPLGNVFGAEAQAEVRVFDPAIGLVKQVSSTLVPAGTTVTYQFLVSNEGNSPLPADDVLADIRLADGSTPPTPTCNEPAYVSGDDGDGLLSRAEQWLFECAAPIADATTDVAIVRGTGGTQFDPALPVNVYAIDAAFVDVFHPAIEVTKYADPTEVTPSGPVTYTYAVRNTGDVPLANVAARIADDTCSPVTYVSGDLDGDELLDTPNSIFEDAADEVWTFTCTANVDRDTVNTVTVIGTPVDDHGVDLCAPQAPDTDLGRVDVPCDVTDSATAAVTARQLGSITVVKQTPSPSDDSFGFAYDGAAFTLRSGGSQTFAAVVPGDHVVAEQAQSGWTLAGIDCVDPGGGTTVDVAGGVARINVAPGESVTCTFANDPVGESGALAITGTGIARTLIVAGLLLVIGALVSIPRLRRPGPIRG